MIGRAGKSEVMREEGRLTKPDQYALVYSNGRSWVGSLVVMKALPNGLTLSRYGFSVSQRIGKAVTRNRVKRLFRQILRVKSLEPGWDMVFIARPLAANADYAGLEKSIDDLLSRAQLLRPKDTVSQQRLGLGVL